MCCICDIQQTLLLSEPVAMRSLRKLEVIKHHRVFGSQLDKIIKTFYVVRNDNKVLLRATLTFVGSVAIYHF